MKTITPLDRPTWWSKISDTPRYLRGKVAEYTPAWLLSPFGLCCFKSKQDPHLEELRRIALTNDHQKLKELMTQSDFCWDTIIGKPGPDRDAEGNQIDVVWTDDSTTKGTAGSIYRNFRFSNATRGERLIHQVIRRGYVETFRVIYDGCQNSMSSTMKDEFWAFDAQGDTCLHLATRLASQGDPEAELTKNIWKIIATMHGQAEWYNAKVGEWAQKASSAAANIWASLKTGWAA